MLRTPRVLLLTSEDQEATALQAAVATYASALQVSSLPGMLARLNANAYDVLFCSWSFYRADWSGVLKMAQEHSPDLPVLVVSRNGEERQWAEVLGAGAFDLLAWPGPKTTVLALLEQAVDSHEARRSRNSRPEDDPGNALTGAMRRSA
jgi:DNA-binding NtrC family response regulator